MKHHTHIHTQTYARTHSCTHARAHTHTHIHKHTHIHTHMYTQTHKHTHIQIHIHTYTHTCTYIHTQKHIIVSYSYTWLNTTAFIILAWKIDVAGIQAQTLASLYIAIQTMFILTSLRSILGVALIQGATITQDVAFNLVVIYQYIHIRTKFADRHIHTNIVSNTSD